MKEMSVAREIVRFLIGKDCEKKFSVDSETITVSVDQRPGWKLQSVVFSRRALRKLAGDPARAVKLDYLRRELLRIGPSREEYRYPHGLDRRLQGVFSFTPAAVK